MTLAEKLSVVRDQVKMIVFTIEAVDQRCMAADGPVTRTLDEMTDREMRVIYKKACAAFSTLDSIEVLSDEDVRTIDNEIFARTAGFRHKGAWPDAEGMDALRQRFLRSQGRES